MQIECLSPYTPISTRTAIKKDFFIQSRKQDIKSIYSFHHKPIGHGGYGTVYQAKLKQPPYSDRCVKVIKKKLIKNPEVLMNEVDILRKLDHPHVVRLYETYQDESYLYLVEDLCKGGQLFDRIDLQGVFSEQITRKIFTQMVKTIKYLHLQKICHRDLKAENFLFPNEKNDNIMLIDFGLSFQWQNNMREQLEQAGQNKIVGTAYYVAPQILRKNYDERCDIWALGVLLHVMATASAPFIGDDDSQILYKIRNQKYAENAHIQQLSLPLRDLLSKIFVPANQRISIEGILNHPWMAKPFEVSIVKPIQLDFMKMRNFALNSRFKDVILGFISSQLACSDIEDLSDLFQQIDTNNDGVLTVDEFECALKKQGTYVSYNELRQVLKKVDMDKNGMINFNEFLASLLSDDICLRQEYQMYIFKYFDQDCNGKIGRGQLLYQIDKMGLQLPIRVTDEIMKQVDTDLDGEISFEQFIKAITGNN